MYFGRMDDAAREIARLALHVADATLSDSGGGDVDAFVEASDPVLRLRYFPEISLHRIAEREPLRMAAHYDISTVTLIHQTPCPNGFVSLQCEAGKDGGIWADVAALPDALLVICGAVATLVSGGRFEAPRHRVAAPGEGKRVGSERTSSAFFLRPDAAFEFDVRKARRVGLILV
jgi:deacetoxycephalosporin-C synthase